MVVSSQTNKSNRRKLDIGNVPVPFRRLIPYAQKWGISDDGDLDTAIDDAATEDLKDLVTAVSEFQAEGFDEWLGNPGNPPYTREWIAFVCLIKACDLAKLRLRAEDESQ